MLLSFFSANTQAQDSDKLNWVKTLDITGGLYTSSVLFKIGMTNDDCFYIYTFNGELLKLDLNGNILWSYLYQKPGLAPYPICGDQTSDDGYILAGYKQDSFYSDQDTFLLKINSQGDEEWNNSFDIGGSDSAYEIIADTNSYYLLVNSLGNVVLVKTDLSGNLVKKTNITDETYLHGTFQKTSDGDFIILCRNQESNLNLIKFDKDGSIEFDKTYQEGKNFAFTQIFSSVDELDSSGFAIFGNYRVDDDTGYSAIIKTDKNGNKLFLENFEYGYSINYGIGTKDNGFIATGRVFPTLDVDYSNVLVVKSDSSGKEQWNITFGWDARDIGYLITEPSSDNYYVFGTTNHSGTTAGLGGKIFMAKISTSASNQGSEDQAGGESSKGSDGDETPGFEILLLIISLSIIVYVKKKKN